MTAAAERLESLAADSGVPRARPTNTSAATVGTKDEAAASSSSSSSPLIALATAVIVLLVASGVRLIVRRGRSA